MSNNLDQAISDEIDNLVMKVGRFWGEPLDGDQVDKIVACVKARLDRANGNE